MPPWSTEILTARLLLALDAARDSRGLLGEDRWVAMEGLRDACWALGKCILCLEPSPLTERGIEALIVSWSSARGAILGGKTP